LCADCDSRHRNHIGRRSQQQAVGSAEGPVSKPDEAPFDALRLDGEGGGRGEHRAASHVQIVIEEEDDRFAFGGFSEIAVHRRDSCDAGLASGHRVRDFVSNTDDA
jgi:hypothetical protein